MTRIEVLSALFAGAGLLLASTLASATTGSGCWQPVGVALDDVLNVRASRSARSAIVGAIPPRGGPIIVGGSSRWQAEDNCTPSSRPRPSRWCRVSVYGAGGNFSGYVKRRYLSPSDCP